jgi:hypothetical protein
MAALPMVPTLGLLLVPAPPWVAPAAGLVSAVVIGLAWFGTPVAEVSSAFGEGFWILVEVLAIIAGGILLSRVMDRTGAQKKLARWLSDGGGPTVLSALLMVHGVVPFMETVTGFGVSVIIGLPLLLSLGFTPLRAASLSLVALMANVFVGGLVDVFPSDGASSSLLHNFVELAFATPYLLHEMLAVSALRLFAEHGQRHELVARASFHQTKALGLVQPYVTAVTEEQCLPLLFFSSFAAISGLAEVALDAHRGCDKFADPIAKTTHSFQLSRGIMTMLTPHWPYICQTWAWTIISSQIEACSDLTPLPETIPTYTTLRSLAFGVEPDQARKACLRAVELTLGSLSLVQQCEDASVSRRLVTSWPIEVDAEFHLLLADRKPVSLVILAHYAALLSLGTGLWWVGRWPALLLEHISSALGEEWAEFLTWPRNVVLNGPGYLQSNSAS